MKKVLHLLSYLIDPFSVFLQFHAIFKLWYVCIIEKQNKMKNIIANCNFKFQ